MPVFPSTAWFQQVAELAMADDTYRRFGRVDAIVGCRIGECSISMVFDVFAIRDVRAIEDDELRDLDFYLEMEPALWQAMIEDIKHNDGAGLEYTLNTLDLKLPNGLAVNALGDGYRMDKFFRFNQSLQRYFDLSAQLDTSFALPAPAGRE